MGSGFRTFSNPRILTPRSFPKRFDVQRIRGLAFADCVERFNLVCILSFVVIEDMSSSGSWTPSLLILKESLKILLSEVAIDILKHAGSNTDNPYLPYLP